MDALKLIFKVNRIIKKKNIRNFLFVDSFGGIHHLFYILQNSIKIKEETLIICANKEIYSFPLKFGRKKPIIRESLIPSNIIDILKNEEVLYTVVSVFQSETYLKPHRDPHIYQFPYKRIQIPLDIPDKNKCYMEWTDNGGRIDWEEGVPQVCDVMHHTHQAYNKSDKEMVIIMMDVKMDTEVEL